MVQRILDDEVETEKQIQEQKNQPSRFSKDKGVCIIFLNRVWAIF
jgi:hypothetical protein